MAEWFEDWFNTDEYLEVYKHRNEKEAELLVELILNNVNLKPGSSVLDLACGAGRHSLLFAQKGFDVTAIDLSESLLKIGREQALNLSLNVNFVRSDLRKINLSSSFDLVLNLFTSFGYFESDEENFRIFEKITPLMNPGGTFVLDFINHTYLKNNLIPESTEEFTGGILIQKRKIIGNRVVKEIIINKNGLSKTFSESVRLFTPEELCNSLNKNGLVIKKKFGDFNGNEYDALSSPRIILFAEK